MPLIERKYRAIRRKARKEAARLLDGDSDEDYDVSMDYSTGSDSENCDMNIISVIDPTQEADLSKEEETVQPSQAVNPTSSDHSFFSEGASPTEDTFPEENYEVVGDSDSNFDEMDFCDFQGDSIEESTETHDVENGKPLDVTDLMREIHEIDSLEGDDFESDRDTLRSELALWALKHNVTHSAIDNLLDILKRNNHPDLPKSAKTLLKTPRNVSKSIKVCAGGYMWYKGILKCLQEKLRENSSIICDNVITIDVHVDGVSPYKSVRKSLWPILCCVAGESDPFVVGLWCGEGHPTDSNEFFEDFITEAKSLMNGFTWENRQLKLSIRRIIADAPARAWLKKVNQHGSKICCERCNVEGVWLQGRMTFNICSVGELRSDEGFVAQSQLEYHKGTSSFLELDIKMIKQIPLEPMHLVYLGVIRRLLAMLLLPKASQYKLSKSKVEELSKLLEYLKPYIPSEFGRKPRTLLEWKLYKATELRRILYYDGLLLFRQINNDVYQNFLLLHCALRILNDANLKDFILDADTLLKEFVSTAVALYGKTFNVYNVHHLLHLAEECKVHGILDDFTAFIYENFLMPLKTLLRAPGRTLTQIAARIIEKAQALPVKKPAVPSIIFSQKHYDGPLHILKGNQYRKVELFGGTVFQTSFSDACCKIQNGTIVRIRNIVQEGDSTFIVGQAFEKMENHFQYPLPSSVLGIFEICNLGNLNSWPIQCILKKYVLLPIPDKQGNFAARHSEEFSRFLAIPMFKNESVTSGS